MVTLLERAELLAGEGAEAEMAVVLAERALPLLATVPGVMSVRFGRGVENPGKFMLLVAWESMAAHAAFSQASISAEFRALIMPLSRGGTMEHFEMDRPATA